MRMYLRRLVPSKCYRYGFVFFRTVSSYSSTKELKEELERLQKEAERKGFARRDNAQDIDLLLEKSKKEVELLPGSNTLVAHLPPKKDDITPFDEYKRSTVEFASLVSTYGVRGTGLGAGFGVSPDKRLGFLRPRQTLQPRGSSGSVEPKFDENGMPIDVTLPKSELLQRRKEYLQSFQGTTMSSREHFLLVDLDFDKDAVLFGRTREEFERNVKILQKVIVGYQRWEKSDNFYYYSTVGLKILTFWVLMECMHQYYELQLLATQYPTFAEGMEKEIAEIRSRQREGVKLVLEELERRPPNFKPTLKAISEERERFLATKEEKRAAVYYHSLQVIKCGMKKTMKYIRKAFFFSVFQEKGRSIKSDSERERFSLNHKVPRSLGPSLSGDTPSVSSEVRKVIPLQEFYQKHAQQHPMDTTGEVAAQEHEKDCFREKEMHEFQKEILISEKVRESTNIFCLLKNKIGGYWHWRSAAVGSLRHPLSKQDISRYSYVASPTSIDAIRRIRRVLLPRTEDLTQVVRDEIVSYAGHKAKFKT